MHYWCQSDHWQENINVLQRTLATSSWRTFALTFSARVEVNVIISESCSASEWTICRFGNILVMPCNFASKWHCLETRVSSSLFISSCNNKTKHSKSRPQDVPCWHQQVTAPQVGHTRDPRGAFLLQFCVLTAITAHDTSSYFQDTGMNFNTKLLFLLFKTTMQQRDFQQDIAVVNIPYYSQNLTAQNIFNWTALLVGFCIKKVHCRNTWNCIGELSRRLVLTSKKLELMGRDQM